MDSAKGLVEPDTRLISQEQLVTEVKGIYAGLVMVESKRIEVDNTQSTSVGSAHEFENEQWQALIALHRTLLHEHHDFFLASQHPSASPALRRLATKYAMPASMWRHGIHSFLELLRHVLPDSLEHMLTFIYLAYSMMALLHETVPAFEDTWIECLGDISRYRMAIEDDDNKDREAWTAVARHWYSKASDKSPTTGRLYHHLAILARPNAVQQLYYYKKALRDYYSFQSDWDCIMNLFDPILTPRARGASLQPTHFKPLSNIGWQFNHLFDDLRRLGVLPPPNPATWAVEPTTPQACPSHEHPTIPNGMQPGAVWVHLPKPTLAMLASYLELSNRNKPHISDHTNNDDDESVLEPLSSSTRRHECSACMRVQPHCLCDIIHDAILLLLPVLNAMLQHCLHQTKSAHSEVEDGFWASVDSCSRPLPEDHAMRGLLWSDDYFPPQWLSTGQIDEDEKYFVRVSMVDERRYRSYFSCGENAVSSVENVAKRLSPLAHSLALVRRPKHLAVYARNAGFNDGDPFEKTINHLWVH